MSALTSLGAVNHRFFLFILKLFYLWYRSRGKESTEVRIRQNKGKESENSYRKLKSSRWTGTQTNTRKQNRNISTDTAVLLNQKRANVCEHDKDDVTRVFERCHQGVARGMDGGKFKRRLSEVNAKAVSRGQMHWYASSRWRWVIWSVLGGRLWSKRTFQQELKGSW